MSVHRLPPRDEPFDPRLAALAHAGMAATIAEQIGHADPTNGLRLAGELANAVACGLVYVGDQIRAGRAAHDRKEALERIRDHEEHFGSGPPDDEMREIAHAALEGTLDEGTLDETVRWREFHSGLAPASQIPSPSLEQAAQIPEGIESAARELADGMEMQSIGWSFGGVPVPEGMAEPILALADWLNQLSNVRREVADGSAGE